MEHKILSKKNKIIICHAGDKFSPPFLTGRSTRFPIGPSIRRLIGFPYLIAH
ncbi:hypothetical protein T01_12867 [Trichinella spiralis]|uniref:Uncharacterized protein n=1 Tax=Trichinella spiralis TaxID=6334 RepID=A0A0V1BRM5_TRISP|nr:hypothetical protein T01_12867 [Trichinella spiralis]